MRFTQMMCLAATTTLCSMNAEGEDENVGAGGLAEPGPDGISEVTDLTSTEDNATNAIADEDTENDSDSDDGDGDDEQSDDDSDDLDDDAQG